jgi:hypothetical protein
VLAYLDARRPAVSTDREASIAFVDLEAALPYPADGMGPILAALECEALAYSGVIDGGEGTDAGTASIGSYVITLFGQRVLAWLSSSVTP